MGKFKVKTTNKKTIEVNGKLVKNTPPIKTPQWFLEFQNDQRQFNKEVIERFDKQEEFNQQQKEFNKEQKDFNQKVIQRINDLVFKNNLNE